MFEFKVEISRLARNYQTALNSVGIEAVPHSNALLDGLVLTGGGDVSPCLYAQVNTFSRDVDLLRDMQEFLLIKKYYDANKPILGICRGLQVINVYFGGSLFQNVEGHSQINDTDAVHQITTIDKTFMREIFGEAFSVNSAHHQAVDKLGKGLMVSARTIGGVVEAVQGKNVIATQFHPERLSLGGDNVFKYFKMLLEKAKR